MISSMTAFSRKSHEDRWGSIVWEIRTVNHRYLDLSLRLPEPWRALEMSLRECILQHVQRGKVDAILKFQPGPAFPVNFAVNFNVVERLLEVGQEISKRHASVQINLMDMLSWPGVLQTKEESLEVINRAVQKLLQTTLNDLIEVRHREGASLQHFIQEALMKIQKQMDKVRECIPNALKNERGRIVARFEEMRVALEKERLEQEMLWLIQKSDITEEVVRLATHIKEVQQVIKKGGVIGRRLDFLMQELHRETNTIASKSQDADISQATIETKVLIEQIREQVQNIE